MSWPLSQDYNEVIQDAANSFDDAELKTGEAVSNPLGIPLPRSGNFADVYEVRCPSGSRWAVKCFTREVPRLRERYGEISKFLRQANLPFMVDFQYLEQGIRVCGRWYPVLKMQWVEGFTLNEFVRDNLDNPALLEGLSRIWLKMAQRLSDAGLGHGDLQHGNILLVAGSSASSLAVKLIDYDGMWVPALAQTPSGEVGHPAFQHPERLRTGAYNQEVDRFSLLAIATALRCLTVGGRSLWERYDNGDNLLFRQADLQAPDESPLFQELLTNRDPLPQKLVKELYRACRGPMDKVPLVTDLLSEEKAAAAVVPRGQSPAASRTAAEVTEESNAFQDIEPKATTKSLHRKSRRDKGTSAVLWVVGSVVAACVFLGGALLWTVYSKSQPNKPPLLAAEMPRPDTPPLGKNVENKRPEPAMALIVEEPPGEVRHVENHEDAVFDVTLTLKEQTQVKKAIDRGVGWLEKSQTPGGSWGSGVRPIGLAALPALTLLECGVKADDLRIRNALNCIRKSIPTLNSTYELTLVILFLDRLGDPADEQRIQTCALRLVAGQSQAGGWSYRCPLLNPEDERNLLTVLEQTRPKNSRDLFAAGSAPPWFIVQIPNSPQELRDAGANEKTYAQLPATLRSLPALQPVEKAHTFPSRDTSDNSNTQFAILGLLAASKRKLPVERTQAVVFQRFRTSQFPNGHWNYHGSSPLQPRLQASPAMTGAGLLGLAVGIGLAADYLGPQRRSGRFEDPAIEKGFTFLGEHIGKLLGADTTREKNPKVINLYFLWTIERCGVLFNRRDIAGKDWYRWGKKLLLENQGDDGSWNAHGYPGATPVVDTCFALLFLKRANLAKDLTEKLKLFMEGK